MCKERKIKGYSKKKKSELISILSSAPKIDVETDVKSKPLKKNICLK